MDVVVEVYCVDVATVTQVFGKHDLAAMDSICALSVAVKIESDLQEDYSVSVYKMNVVVENDVVINCLVNRVAVYDDVIVAYY